jgi:hypothetical protein
MTPEVVGQRIALRHAHEEVARARLVLVQPRHHTEPSARHVRAHEHRVGQAGPLDLEDQLGARARARARDQRQLAGGPVVAVVGEELGAAGERGHDDRRAFEPLGGIDRVLQLDPPLEARRRRRGRHGPIVRAALGNVNV